uniref:Uncharacterized protein n=1 Tax=Oncorhynchus tshawytscha TaxID=74940 RepID=A0A8C8CAN0_ONCTS
MIILDGILWHGNILSRLLLFFSLCRLSFTLHGRCAVYDQTAIALAGETQFSHPPFSGNRPNTEKHILTSLAEENFDKFMTYIHNPRKHFEKFNERECREIYAHRKTVKNRNGDTNMWLRELSRALKDYLKLAENHFRDFCDITDFDFLKEEVKEGLANRIMEINRSLSNVSLLGMKQFRERPDEILIKHFCDSICTNTKCNGWFYPSHESEDKYIITPDLSEIPYWKWFVCQFQEDLERYYDLNFQGKYVIIEAWVKVQCQVIFITAQVDLEPGYGK